MISPISTDISFSANSEASKSSDVSVKFKNQYHFECFDSEGNLKWEEIVFNLVTDEGLNDILNKYYKGSSYSAAHYVGLLSATPTIVAGDTASSHSGWTEVTVYDETVRPTLTLGTVSAKSVSNTASKAVFTMNATVTVGGSFVITNSTKGGTSGVLVGAATFTTGNKILDAGDILNVTITLNAASA